MKDQTNGGSSETTESSAGVYETENGELVLYEEHKPDAYVRSDLFVEVEQ